jgi:hypothetical protein
MTALINDEKNEVKSNIDKYILKPNQSPHIQNDPMSNISTESGDTCQKQVEQVPQPEYICCS